ncbi:MAG: DNA polymerase I [Pseudomonadales bacterium]|nr:DNA polymerase I [Pseudomonadales bacterium]
MPNTNKAPLVLVDGSSYLFRAFYAIKADLRTASGKPTAAVRGVISMIRRLMKDYPESNIAVVFDAKGKTFRHDLYADYKANRPPMPDDLRVQIEPIHRIIEAMGIPLLVIDDVEADDVIGTLATQATENQFDTVISTGDKDMAQLVSDHVSLVNTMDGTKTDKQGVIEKFGVPAERIIDYLALVGDSSDNIPGVPKCGPKTAVKWLNEYGSFQAVLEHADEIGGKVGENLRSLLEILPLSYQLASIKTDVALDVTPESLIHKEPDREALFTLFKELEFKSWAEEISAELPVGSGKQDIDSAQPNSNDSSPPKHYELVLDQQRFEHWLNKIEKANLVAFDTETTSLNYMEARLVGVSLAVKPLEACYIPVGHDYLGAPSQLELSFILEKLKPFLENAECYKVGQNLKYDMNILANHGVKLAGIAQDTMLQSYVLNSTERHDMDSLALRYLDHETIHFEDVAGKGAKQLTFNQVDLEKAGEYAAEDADITLRLFNQMSPMLESEPSLKRVYQEIELPLVPVLSRIECKGALVDAKMLGLQSQELAKRLLQIERQAFELAGEEFNLGSPKQLQAIFYEKLKLPILKKTPKGQPSTAEPVLQELALDYPLPKVILEYRSLSKLKSTYTDKLPLQINPKTGRIHTSYHQAVTATGRLSSSDPNLQNIPIRTEEGRKIRKAFIAPKGYKLVAADYSQIELRIMAHLSQDKGLLEAFAKGMDVHRATAAEVFSTRFEDVSNEQRRSAKAINFGLIYGMSAFGLGRQLGIGRKEAQAYIDLYFERYPGVLNYMDNIRAQAAEKGYVETLFGRRLYLPEINSRNGMQRQAAERTAINAPMQGTAADIIKKAMIEVDRWLEKDRPDAQVIMQVHDELVLEVVEGDLDQVIQKLREHMCSTVELDVPLIVDIGIGDNWDEAH